MSLDAHSSPLVKLHFIEIESLLRFELSSNRAHEVNILIIVLFFSAVSRPMGPPVNLKILVPAIASGAIIGKGGETIADVQKQTGTRIKMSKANDFYPGTTERVGLIQGPAESVLVVMDFIAEKIIEKPDPAAKPAIDFDNKIPAEREKQVKVIIPNSTAGMIIGKGGSFIKQLKDESGAFIQISQKSKDATLSERVVTIIGKQFLGLILIK